jgi:hypothetical protein
MEEKEMVEVRWAAKVLMMGCVFVISAILLLVFGVVAILKWGFS